MGHEFSRVALYDLVWSEPKSVLAKKLEVSDVGLGKACQKANIPVPPRGHWALRDAGRPVIKIPLPARGLGQSDIVSIGRATGWSYNEPIGELPALPVFPESLDRVIQRAKVLIGKVSVPKSLDSPHHQVAKLLAQDEERRKKLADTGFYWHGPHFDLPAAKRRLRLINAIFLALARAGCKPAYSGKGADSLSVQIGDQWVGFVIEPTKVSRQHDFLFDADNGSPRQTLRIKVETTLACPDGIGKEWVDGPTQTLEGAIPNVVLSLVVFGELHHRANAQCHYDRLVERKAEQEGRARKARELAEQKAREERLRQEKARRDHLFTQAMNWEMAARLIAFVKAVQDLPEAVEQRELVEEWAAWALSEADALDPMRGSVQAIVGITGAKEDENSSDMRQGTWTTGAQSRSLSQIADEHPYFPGMPWFLRGRR